MPRSCRNRRIFTRPHTELDVATALRFAIHCADTLEQDDVVVLLLDEARHVLDLLRIVPAELGRADGEAAALDIALHVADADPSIAGLVLITVRDERPLLGFDDDDCAAWHALRARCADDGVILFDWLPVHRQEVRSMALATDGEPGW